MASSEKYEETSEHSETESTEEEEEIGEEEIADILSNLQPYQYEPRKHGSDSSSSSESDVDPRNILPDDLSEISEDEDERDVIRRQGNTDWCNCGNCKKETKEIDCLCCQEVDAISEEKFENQNCVPQNLKHYAWKNSFYKMFSLVYTKQEEIHSKKKAT